MDAEVYPDAKVSEFINSNFIPVKIHVKENPQGFERFGAQWTPTLIIADPGPTERYRFEGYLPPDDFLAQLQLGLAKAAFARNDFATSESLFRKVVDEHPNTDVAPEALYWAGVSKYKATNDPKPLQDTAAAFATRYSDSSWAKKASVWKG